MKSEQQIREFLATGERKIAELKTELQGEITVGDAGRILRQKHEWQIITSTLK